MTTKKTSVRAAVRDAQREDKLARVAGGSPLFSGVTNDSFVNFAHKLGMGADNALSTGTYGFNPITRNRILLEWIHRGSWLGGVAVDVIADDMTRKGIEITSEMEPDDMQTIEHAAVNLGIWEQTNETIKWARLYGGSVAVMLVDGQDLRTPLNLETVGPGQFKGLLSLDRWMLDPSLGDLVTEYGPHLGLPKFYTVQQNAPALRGQAIHHSRLAFRMVGVQLPYQQRLTENLWGISVLERLYDRMVSFDSATMGAAQLTFKAYLRTMKIEGFREIVSAGGAALNGLLSYTEMMRRFQGQEGITLIDGKDEFEVQQQGANSFVGDTLLNLGQQISGALQIPLVRLFGQSPAGLNSTGESDLRMYYDGIQQRQETEMRVGIVTTYKLLAQSEGIVLPDDFSIEFNSLWDLDDAEKATVAKSTGEAIGKAMDDGLIGRQTGLKELRQSSRRTGIFTNITQEMIEAADDEVLPPLAETMMEQEHDLKMAKATGKGQDLPGDANDKSGSKRKAKPVANGARRRVNV